MRTLVIKQNTRLDALSQQLLKPGLSDAQAKSALASLQELNPHADLANLSAGTVLFVPDTPSFQPAASDAVAGGPLDDFQQLLRKTLSQAAAELKATTSARAAERAAILKTLKSTPVRRAIEGDAELKRQVNEVGKALDQEEEQSNDADRALAAASRAAQALHDTLLR